ncbi:ParA family protein [Canibacter sp. lx-45]|nr:ParA family protein [Canibacter zhuwentaonis]
MKVLSVSSLKGGVGKTTIALGLASAAFSRGLSTLVIDLDPQSDISTGLDVDPSGQANIADVLANPARMRDAIVKSGWNKHHAGHIDLLLGSPSAINHDGPHPSMRDIWRLEDAIAPLEKEYDFVIIDCPPSLNALTRTGWAASDRTLIVTEPSLFSVAAADRALRAIDEVRAGISSRLAPLGIVINRTRSKSPEHKYRIREMREMFGAMVLDPVFMERSSVQQSTGSAKPIHMWPTDGARQAAGSYDTLLDIAAKSMNMNIPAAPQNSTPLFNTDDILDETGETIL